MTQNLEVAQALRELFACLQVVDGLIVSRLHRAHRLRAQKHQSSSQHIIYARDFIRSRTKPSKNRSSLKHYSRNLTSVDRSDGINANALAPAVDDEEAPRAHRIARKYDDAV